MYLDCLVPQVISFSCLQFKTLVSRGKTIRVLEGDMECRTRDGRFEGTTGVLFRNI